MRKREHNILRKVISKKLEIRLCQTNFLSLQHFPPKIYIFQDRSIILASKSKYNCSMIIDILSHSPLGKNILPRSLYNARSICSLRSQISNIKGILHKGKSLYLMMGSHWYVTLSVFMQFLEKILWRLSWMTKQGFYKGLRIE